MRRIGDLTVTYPARPMSGGKQNAMGTARTDAATAETNAATEAAKERLLEATGYYKYADVRLCDAREELAEALFAALRAGVAPSMVAQLSPYTASYVRRLARMVGIEAAK